jgi:cyclic pyranopterin phosphate synthase
MYSPSTTERDDSAGAVTSSLIDNHGRPITYLRLAITDRCNLRCQYCMPEQGIAPLSHDETLSYEELEYLVALFTGLGIDKIRITGGEPFARRGCLEFIQRLKDQTAIKQIFLTTNGVETWRYLDRLKEMGISGINLSLDTLDKQRFKEITRRDRLEQVLETLHGALERDILLKVNSVVTEDTGDEEILDLARLAQQHPLSLRFIEKMPFSGEDEISQLPEDQLFKRLGRLFPELKECQSNAVSTARLFSGPNYRGTLGIIEGKSRKFCATCNKIRITPQGILKACLYDNGVLDLKALLRSGVKGEEIVAAVRRCLNRRHADGHETESVHCRASEPSMASIGG